MLVKGAPGLNRLIQLENKTGYFMVTELHSSICYYGDF